MTMQERINAIHQELLPDEYHASKKMVATAQHLLMSAPESYSVPNQLGPFECGEIREEWITAQIDAKDMQDRLARRRAILSEVVRDANNQALTAAASILPRELAAYHKELESLLDDVADLADQLDDIRTAEQAITADRTSEWKRLSELVNDYEDLRRAQLSRTDVEMIRQARPSEYDAEDHASDLYIRNLDELWPRWRFGDAAPNGMTTITVGDTARRRYAPWPADRTQLLIWLATSRAEAWIPTPTQLQQLWAERSKPRNPKPTTETKEQKKLRAEYQVAARNRGGAF